MMDRDTVIGKVKDSGISLVRFLYCDNGGTIRGKITHSSSLASRMDSGSGLPVAMQAMNALDQLQPVEGMGPVGEIRLMPDPNTFRLLPYAPRSGAMMADMLTLDAQPWGACPRSFLKRMIARGAEQGLSFLAAFEPEWSLAVKEGESYRPIDESVAFSGVGMTPAAAVIDDLVDALESQGIRFEQYYPELGYGQQEVSIGHTDPLTAADNHIRYRETVRNVAWRHGMYASFAPKPWIDQAGNGCHIHISGWDAEGKNSLFLDAGDRYKLSPMGYHFIGGLLDHLPSLVAITCPSFNSYRRLQPEAWSSAFTCYGPDNREAAVRISSPFWDDEAGSVNPELKPADSSCNPYLALGAMMAAGLDGVSRRVDPGEGRSLDVDPATLPEALREERGIRRLPQTLADALDQLENDSLLLDAMGELLARSFIAVRRSEWNEFSTQDQAYEMRHHFYKY